MSVVWIICPITGVRASTGIETDVTSFGALKLFELTLTCPECGEVHVFDEMQGYLVGESPATLQ